MDKLFKSYHYLCFYINGTFTIDSSTPLLTGNLKNTRYLYYFRTNIVIINFKSMKNYVNWSVIILLNVLFIIISLTICLDIFLGALTIH
jgi:hypothetical protein